MDYGLAPGISFARVGDQPIFLDRARDRYFGLKPDVAKGFLALSSGDQAAAGAINSLLRRGIIVSEVSDARLEPFVWMAVNSSLLEDGHRPRATPTGMASVALAMQRARRSLKTLRLDDNLRRLAARKAALSSEDTEAIEAAAGEFLACRRFIPLRPVCLLDSIGLLEFLAMRRCTADLVLAVGVKPFNAHCWVQHGEQALNERMLRVAGLTPILVG